MSELSAFAVPVIAPVDVFNVKPVGNEPTVTEYVIDSPSASVAPHKSEAAIPELLKLSNITKVVSAAFVNVTGASCEIAPANSAERPEPFVTLIVYGSLELSKSALAIVTVKRDELFLVVVRGDKVSLVPINVTVAPVVSNKEPLTSIVVLPPAEASILPEVTSEPPSIVKPVIIGGASIDFHSVPV